ncbi:hypothetical protein DL95DRAFT_301483 [Leptodontidium sp. 2 PMI_412]|nr:hypothetical protein DL95DRAFT_301483 [Leptodontidium sp. 2 PMI_412]
MSKVSSTISPTSYVSLGTWDEHRPLVLSPLDFDELLNNFCTETYHTIHRDPVQQSVWKDSVPRIARSFDFVMHSLLALSALHLSYLYPQEESYALQALLHHQFSIHLARKVLPRITNENCSALYIFSMLLALYVIARPRKPEDLLLVGDGEITSWLMMFRGTRTIADNWRESLISGPLAPMLMGGMQRVELQNSANNPLSIGEEQLMVLHGHIVKATAADVRLSRIYSEAIEELRKSFMAFDIDQYNHGTTDAFIWVHRVSDEYLLLLGGHTQESLCILAFFSVLLHKTKAKWWCEGWSAHLMTQINRLLDEPYRPWIWWASKEVFGEIKV